MPEQPQITQSSDRRYCISDARPANGGPSMVPDEKVHGRPGGRSEWKRGVLAANQNRCGNCGGTDRLSVVMVVPEEAGGLLLISNGVVLCRTCEMAADTVKSKKSGEERRPCNVWISRNLFDSVHRHLEDKSGFSSMGSLIRYLISKYVEAPGRFDDLTMYQDGESSVKINCWIGEKSYAEFKDLVASNGSTITDCVKALLLFFAADPEQVIRRNTNG